MRRRTTLVGTFVALNVCLLALVVWQGEPQVARGEPGDGLAQRVASVEGNLAVTEARVAGLDLLLGDSLGFTYTHPLALPARVGGLEILSDVYTNALALLGANLTSTFSETQRLGKDLADVSIVLTKTLSLVRLQAATVISLTETLRLLEEEVNFLRECCPGEG
jgi:hypothetical protein